MDDFQHLASLRAHAPKCPLRLPQMLLRHGGFNAGRLIGKRRRCGAVADRDGIPGTFRLNALQVQHILVPEKTEPEMQRRMMGKLLEPFASQLHERTEFLLRIEPIEAMQREVPSCLFEQRQIPADEFLFEGQVSRAKIDDRGDIGGSEKIVWIVHPSDRRLDLVLSHR